MRVALYPRTERRSPLRAVRQHPLFAFVLFAFGGSWLYELVMFGVLHLPLLPWAIPGIFAPALAAFVVTDVTEGSAGVRDLWRHCIRWRVGLRWYLLVLLGVPALLAISFVFLPGGMTRFHGVASIVPVYLAQFVVIFLLGGGQEEPGWRGFALPRLQERHGALAGSLLIGLLWASWHLPLFLFVPGYDHAGSGFSGIAATFALFSLFTLGLSAILTWVYNSTGGSVLLAMLLHGAVNATFALAPATRLATATKYLWVDVLAIALILATGERLGDTTRKG